MEPPHADALRTDDALSPGYLVRVLRSLVRTKSVNPGIYEKAMTHRVADWFADTPAEVHFVESLPDRHSVAAVLRGTGRGPTLVLNGHMDTVPIDHLDLWSVDPFAAEVRDGYLWGRGAASCVQRVTPKRASKPLTETLIV